MRERKENVMMKGNKKRDEEKKSEEKLIKEKKGKSNHEEKRNTYARTLSAYATRSTNTSTSLLRSTLSTREGDIFDFNIPSN